MTRLPRVRVRGALAACALACLGLLGITTPQRCEAQAVQPREALEDAKLYFTAPLRWDAHDWLAFGGTLAAIGVAHEFDE
jgi:hypothetical protein